MGNDDGFAAGRPEVLFPAFEEFVVVMREQCGLELYGNRKVGLYIPPNVDTPADIPVGLEVSGCEVQGSFERGFVCYGAPIGTPAFVRAKLNARVAVVRSRAERAVAVVLPQVRQAAWQLLQFSILHQMD